MATLSISDLLNALSTSHGDKFIRREVSTWLGAAPAKAAKKSKPKAPAKAVDHDSDGDASPGEAKTSKKGAWPAFVKVVCGPPREPTTGFAAWLEDHSEYEGKGHLVPARSKYAKEVKGDGNADYEAFKAEFKSSSSASLASSADGDGGAAPAEKPKRKPGRPKKAESGVAAAGGGGGGAAFSLTDSEDEAPKPKPKPKAKKAPGAPKKAPKKELPPLPASDDEDNITLIDLFGEPFYWDSDTHLLYQLNEDRSRGKIIGTYNGDSATFGTVE
jgi:hypothetical protein